MLVAGSVCHPLSLHKPAHAGMACAHRCIHTCMRAHTRTQAPCVHTHTHARSMCSHTHAHTHAGSMRSHTRARMLHAFTHTRTQAPCVHARAGLTADGAPWSMGAHIAVPPPRSGGACACKRQQVRASRANASPSLKTYACHARIGPTDRHPHKAFACTQHARLYVHSKD